MKNKVQACNTQSTFFGAILISLHRTKHPIVIILLIVMLQGCAGILSKSEIKDLDEYHAEKKRNPSTDLHLHSAENDDGESFVYSHRHENSNQEHSHEVNTGASLPEQNDNSQSSVFSAEEVRAVEKLRDGGGRRFSIAAALNHLDSGGLPNAFRDAGINAITQSGGMINEAKANDTDTGYHLELKVEQPFKLGSFDNKGNIFAGLRFLQNSVDSRVTGTVGPDQVIGIDNIDLDLYYLFLGIEVPTSFNPDLSVFGSVGVSHTVYNENSIIRTILANGSSVVNQDSRREDDTNPSFEIGMNYQIAKNWSVRAGFQWIDNFEAEGIKSDDVKVINLGLEWTFSRKIRLPRIRW